MDTLPYAVQTTFPLLFMLIPALGALLGCRRSPDRPAAEIWQRWWSVGALGIGSLWITISFLAIPEGMADAIGFTPSPFQFEIAFANLGLALLGFRGASASPRERLTSGLAAAAFLWGAAIGHVYQWFAHGDHAAGNTGGILANDLLIPAVMIALAARDVRRTRSGRGHAARLAA
ncbi:hypothetical protein OEIGOIKO_01049 [Streptomyces chrestomyceticus JCM 4735]|uniref:Integral membrane protein n=1 Tax=Streptomyces chrestomyceticus JCM 4735 TaxID=1306181 RepID=A0A7U9KQ13_9ACTN|nr:DUF6790 family protein [Streptomyces chrestomyceticus]GCD33330.1 hypothetical protein OEIGOIKO_01049 [Streptomyces chrestomyceticus JCM 4735]